MNNFLIFGNLSLSFTLALSHQNRHIVNFIIAVNYPLIHRTIALMQYKYPPATLPNLFQPTHHTPLNSARSNTLYNPQNKKTQQATPFSTESWLSLPSSPRSRSSPRPRSSSQPTLLASSPRLKCSIRTPALKTAESMPTRTWAGSLLAMEVRRTRVSMVQVVGCGMGSGTRCMPECALEEEVEGGGGG